MDVMCWVKVGQNLLLAEKCYPHVDSRFDFYYQIQQVIE
jgi:hypothetical protein